MVIVSCVHVVNAPRIQIKYFRKKLDYNGLVVFLSLGDGLLFLFNKALSGRPRTVDPFAFIHGPYHLPTRKVYSNNLKSTEKVSKETNKLNISLPWSWNEFGLELKVGLA